MACPDCGLDVPKLEPRSFSFNSTFGACPNCHGLGSLYDFDPAKVITDWSKPLLDGGLGPGSSSQYLIKLIQLAADRYKIDLKVPVRRPAAAQQHLLVYGPPKGEAPRTGFHGILSYLRDNATTARSEGYREYMMSFMSAVPCPVCRGKRLRPSSHHLAVKTAASPSPTSLPSRSIARSRPPSTCNSLSAKRSSPSASAARLPSAWNFSTPSASTTFRSTARRHALRRRGPAHSPGHADRLAPARRAVCARRALHRAASARQQSPAPGAGKPARPGQHGAGRRARRRHHPPGRLRARPRAPARARTAAC
jgi:hypothetical protein